MDVLGSARISGPHGAKHLERKAAALVAYLALEGPSAKWKLAGLLWPESPETTARSNLRQLLRRLRQALGEECVEGRDPVRLRGTLAVDVLTLKAAFEAKEYAKASEFSGELLAGCTYDDCTELEDWLRIQRGWVQRLQRRALEEHALQLEREGRLGGALESARRLLALDQTSEEACRHVMRLHFLSGDGAAALQAYRQCREVLHRELGVVPSEETRQLARSIEQHGSAVKLPVRPTGGGLPLSVVFPPVLAGREREWADLEAAAASGDKSILVCGEPGIGKTRLVTDFAKSRGRWLLLAARPGDVHVPYSTHARSARRFLDMHPIDGMEPWIKREVSRLVPEIGDEALPLPPPPEDKARFFRGIFEFFRAACRGLDAVVFDDGQYIDAGSFELGLYFNHEILPESKQMPVIINSYRPVELESSLQEVIQKLIEMGGSACIQLTPLNPSEVRELIEGMRVPAFEKVADDIAQYTGGNPLFVVETVKHLLESGDFDGRLPAFMPLPGRVGSVMERRLGRLSPEALRLARTIAVAQTDIEPEVAAELMDVPLAQLVEPWQELQNAHILRGTWFTHDLLGETLLKGTPEPLRQALARRLMACRQRTR